MFPGLWSSRVAAALLLSSFLIPPASASAAEAGFKPLFNGRDLRGWVNVN